MLKRLLLFLTLASLGSVIGLRVDNHLSFSHLSYDELKTNYRTTSESLYSKFRRGEMNTLRTDASYLVNCSLYMLDAAPANRRSSALADVGRAYVWNGDRESAESYFKKAREEAKTSSDIHFAYLWWSGLYSRNEDFQSLASLANEASESVVEPRHRVEWKIKQAEATAHAGAFDECRGILATVADQISEIDDAKIKLSLTRNYWSSQRLLAHLEKDERRYREFKVEYHKSSLELARLEQQVAR